MAIVTEHNCSLSSADLNAQECHRFSKSPVNVRLGISSISMVCLSFPGSSEQERSILKATAAAKSGAYDITLKLGLAYNSKLLPVPEVTVECQKSRDAI